MLNQLKSFSGARSKPKRLGRGKSCGHGGTSTKGHKGQKARSGFGLLRGFEGGQMPLVRSLPKFGFTNKRFKTRYDVVTLSDLNRFDSEVTPTLLHKRGLVKKKALVKILATGELKKPITIKAHRFSAKAMELIKKAGGKAEPISLVHTTEKDFQKADSKANLKAENTEEKKADSKPTKKDS